MGETLMTYPSKSNPAKEYHIIRGKDDVTYCDCMGWKMNKHCRHLDAYLALPGRKGVKTAAKDPEPELNQTIESIVAEIRRGT